MKRKLGNTCVVPPKKRITTYQPDYGSFGNEDVLVHVMHFVTDIETFSAFVLTCKTVWYCWDQKKGKGELAYHIDEPIYTTIYFVPGLVHATFTGRVTQTHFGQPLEVAQLSAMTNPWHTEYLLPAAMIERIESHIRFHTSVEVEYVGVRPRKVVFPFLSEFYLDGDRVFIHSQGGKYRLKIERFADKKEWLFECYKKEKDIDWVKDGFTDRYIQVGRFIHIVSRTPYVEGKRFGVEWACKRFKTSHLFFEKLCSYWNDAPDTEIVFKNEGDQLSTRYLKKASLGQCMFKSGATQKIRLFVNEKKRNKA